MLQLRWLGLTEYQKSEEIQKNIWNEVLNGHQDVLLAVEHPAVITLGKRGSLEKDLLQTAEGLKQKGVELITVDRGGEATLHSKGQLVLYPIVNLRLLNLGVRDYVESLQAATINLLKMYGVEAFVGKDEPGVYTKKGKIAFVGIRVERGVTRHGVSFNVKNDLSLFSMIRSCGVKNQRLDRLSEYSSYKDDSLPEIAAKWLECLDQKLPF